MQRKKPVAIAVGVAVRSIAMNAAEIREIEERLRLMQMHGLRWDTRQLAALREKHK